MNKDQLRKNEELWHEKQGQYPYQAVSMTGQPSPNKLSFAPTDDFICVPVGTVARWGFVLEADRDRFLEAYPDAWIRRPKK